MAIIRTRTICLTLFSRLRLSTSGNAIASPVYQDIDSTEFEDLLPYAEEMYLVSLTENPTANFNWNVYFYSGFNRANELTVGSPPFAIGSLITAAGPKRHNAYTTTTNFLPKSRLVVGSGNGSGSAQETAQTSAMLFVKTVGM